LERDVRAVASIRDLSQFRRFLAPVASRCGQVLNRSDIAAPLGVSGPTISQWLSILDVTGQIILVPPFYENFGKRLVKSPKCTLSIQVSLATCSASTRWPRFASLFFSGQSSKAWLRARS